jgi:hypothetical protein
VIVPETDAEKAEKKRKIKELAIIQEAIQLSEETGEPLEKVKERLFKKEENVGVVLVTNNVLMAGRGDGINGNGISFKPDDRPLLGPISPYFRHLTRQSLREAQRHYREHERMRPCSKLEVLLCMDACMHAFLFLFLRMA